MVSANLCEHSPMSDRPEQRPEGALIGRAQKHSRMSQREAAARASISEARWRNIVSGYQTVSAGVYAPVRGPADTIARMARAVGITPGQLAEAGRDDAAAELSDLPPLEEEQPEPTVAELAAQLAEEKQARMNLERRFDELLAQREEEKRNQGKTG